MPPSRLASCSPLMVMVGIMALRSVYLKITLRSLSPSERAVSTYSLFISSSMDERVSRVVKAAWRKPIAAAGRIRNFRLPTESSNGLA